MIDMWKEVYTMGSFTWIDENRSILRLVKRGAWEIHLNGVLIRPFSGFEDASKYLKNKYNVVPKLGD